MHWNKSHFQMRRLLRIRDRTIRQLETEKTLALAQMDEAIDEYGKVVTENEALRLKAKHTVGMVNTIRGTMQINRRGHKDVFGGAAYLVDHTHMWALVRNVEDLDALLTG